MKGKWYYAAEMHSFDGFRFVPEGQQRPWAFDHGPFDTFGEAKQDAIKRFRCDIDFARGAINDIKQTKKRDCTE